MTHFNKINGLVIPDDLPPKISSLKRQILFFDSISLVHPDDRAVVNDGELTEKFPSMEITWSDYATYPRSDDYEEEFRNIINDTRVIRNRGIIRISHPRVFSSDDAGANFMLYNSVISDETLISSAVPDLTNEQPAIKIPNGYVSGGGISQGGCKSKYSLDVKPPYVINNANDSWNTLASLRAGRFIKTLRRAHMEGCCPLSLDNVNSNIIEAIASQSAEEVYKKSDYIAGMSISLDIVDPVELENALENMSWDDVILIRKELFPKISELRHYIIDQVERLNRCKIYDYGQIREETEKLKYDFLEKQEVLAEAWEKLRIASVMKLGGSIGAGNFGLTLLPASSTWGELLIRTVSVGLIAAASLTPELKSLIPAKRKVKNHPLFFINKLNKL